MHVHVHAIRVYFRFFRSLILPSSTQDVKIGGKSCVKSLLYVSSEKLIVETPSGEGSVPVIVKTRRGGEGTCSVNFTYDSNYLSEDAQIGEEGEEEMLWHVYILMFHGRPAHMCSHAFIYLYMYADRTTEIDVWRDELDDTPQISIQPGHVDDDPLGLSSSRRLFSAKTHVGPSREKIESRRKRWVCMER